MEALDRIKRIRRANPDCEWQADDFRNAGNRARQLWQTIENLFDVQYGLLTDAVAAIDPLFELTDVEKLAIRESEVAIMVGGRQVATSFLKWEHCSKTCGIDNPFEPLVEIFEHGGSVSKEHGRFIDIYDHRGKAVAGLTVRQA